MKFSSFVRKAVVCVVLAAGVALGSSAATTSVVRYLETYDQLHNFVGQDGLFYVREAGAYPHGDPTVRTGWAMYTWDAQNTKWNKVTCEDLMALAALNPNDFLTKRLYAADIGPFKAKVNTWGAAIASNVQAVAEIKADNIIINGRLDTAEKKMGIHGDYIKDLRSRVKVLEDGTPVIEASIQELQDLTAVLGGKIAAQSQDIQNLSNKVVTVDSKIDVTKTAVMAYTDVSIANLKTDIITNTAKRVRAAIETAKTYTDGEILKEATRADQTAQSKVDGKANEIMSKVDGKLGDLGGKENVTEYVNAKASGVLESAAADATTKADKAKVDAVTEAKAAVPGIFDEKIVPVKAEIDAKFTAADAKLAATSNALERSVTEKASAARVASEAFTNDKITNLRSVQAADGNEAMIFNESDGGGSMMTLSDGTKSFVGVNDASKSSTGIAGQIYVIKGNAKTKINMYNGKFCYVKGENPTTDADKAKRELVVKEDLDAASEAAAQALAAAFNLPITFKKGDVKYQLDVVDNGEDDITLKVVRVED